MIIYQIDSLKSQYENLPDEIVTSLEAAIVEGKEALAGDSIDNIKEAVKNLQNESINASMHIQQSMQQQAEDIDVQPEHVTVDADFEEVSP